MIKIIFRRYKKQILHIISNIFNIGNVYINLSLAPDDVDIRVIDKQYDKKNNIQFSTITPVLNEEDNIIFLLESIESQTLLPYEMIIVDAGSTDSTVAKINDYKKLSKLDIILIHSPIKNIGYQRNLAIDAARSEIIVNADAGTVFDKDYTQNLLNPFLEYEGLDLTCGVHYPKHSYPWSKIFSAKEHFSLANQLGPYGACVAYKKSKAIEVGKYPEYLTYAGEDTLFLYKYKKVSTKWVFNKKAFMLWEHAKTLELAQKKTRNYLKGDFENGLWAFIYAEHLITIKARLLMNSYLPWDLIGCDIHAKNYKEFTKKQSEIEIYKRHIEGLCFILSTKDIIATSADSRQIAFEFIYNNYKTFFVNLEVNQEKNKKKKFYDIDHTLLEFMNYRDFGTQKMQDRYGKFFTEKSTFVVVSSDSLILSMVQSIRKQNHRAKIIYYFNQSTNKVNSTETSLLNMSDMIITTNHNNYQYLTSLCPNDKIRNLDNVSQIKNIL